MVGLSFTTGTWCPVWVGSSSWASQLRPILSDPAFWSAAYRTVMYAGVSVPLTVLGGLGLALALNRTYPAAPYFG